MTNKSVDLFWFLSQILKDKNQNIFDELSDVDKNKWSTFMIDKYLSMDPMYTILISDFSRYSLSLPREIVYKFYSNLIPKRTNTFIRYIKGSKKTQTHSPEFIEKLQAMYECSKKDALQYANLFSKDEEAAYMLKFGIIKKKEK
jgi:hypothetical protein